MLNEGIKYSEYFLMKDKINNCRFLITSFYLDYGKSTNQPNKIHKPYKRRKYDAKYKH